MRWCVGKGVIGRAIQNNDDDGYDLAKVWADWRTKQESDWETAPDEVRQGLSWPEFQLAVVRDPDKPAGPFILPTPIYAKGRPLGVVALDAPSELAGVIRASKARELMLAAGSATLASRTEG